MAKLVFYGDCANCFCSAERTTSRRVGGSRSDILEQRDRPQRRLLPQRQDDGAGQAGDRRLPRT